MNDCLFCKIVSAEIPSARVYEDEDVVAFLDIKPVNPGHTLVVPKKHSAAFHDADPATLERLIVAMQKIANAVTNATETQGFNIEQNNGEVAGQVVPHLHFHIIPRTKEDGLKHWPGTPYGEGEMDEMKRRISEAL